MFLLIIILVLMVGAVFVVITIFYALVVTFCLQINRLMISIEHFDKKM